MNFMEIIDFIKVHFYLAMNDNGIGIGFCSSICLIFKNTFTWFHC